MKLIGIFFSLVVFVFCLVIYLRLFLGEEIAPITIVPIPAKNTMVMRVVNLSESNLRIELKASTTSGETNIIPINKVTINPATIMFWSAIIFSPSYQIHLTYLKRTVCLTHDLDKNHNTVNMSANVPIVYKEKILSNELISCQYPENDVFAVRKSIEHNNQLLKNKKPFDAKTYVMKESDISLSQTCRKEWGYCVDIDLGMILTEQEAEDLCQEIYYRLIKEHPEFWWFDNEFHWIDIRNIHFLHKTSKGTRSLRHYWHG